MRTKYSVKKILEDIKCSGIEKDPKIYKENPDFFVNNLLIVVLRINQPEIYYRK